MGYGSLRRRVLNFIGLNTREHSGAGFGRRAAAMAIACTFCAAAGPAAAQIPPWTATAPLNSNAATDSGRDELPQLTTDGAGNWVAVWNSNDTLGGTIGFDQDILVSRSTNNGATWGVPAVLNTNAGTDSGADLNPQVTTDGAGNWVAVWWSNDDLGGTIGSEYDILVSRSTNNGATWTAPAALNTNAGTDSEADREPQVTTDSAGNWVAVWYSYDDLGGMIGTDTDILVSRSPNNGATWTAPAALNTNAAIDSGADYYPQVTTDGAGNWVAVWYSTDDLGGTIGTDADILVSRSTNNGATWTVPIALNSNAAMDSGSDSHPQITADSAGNWVAVWESWDDLGGTIGTDYDILVSRSANSGATWTAPAALNTNAATDGSVDGAPQLTTDGAGNWVAVWNSFDDLGGTIGGEGDILVSRSANSGATWTAPAALSSTAATDLGYDLDPQVTTDGAGTWVAVWYSNGAFGTDYDILYTRATDDFDGDGLSDSDETDIYGTDPNNSDTDGDGLSDWVEINTYLTDPLDPDSDDDGVNDGVEISLSTDPNDDLDFPLVPLRGLWLLGVLLALPASILLGDRRLANSCD